MAKAMGCNSIAAYLFWNYHEVNPVYLTLNPRTVISPSLSVSVSRRKWVLFRPGPYVCAEWGFGGLPVSLLKIPDIKIRCLDTRYMKAVESYISAMARQVKSLQVTAGGPILMVQIENEYGSYGNDKAYLERLRQLWLMHLASMSLFIQPMVPLLICWKPVILKGQRSDWTVAAVKRILNRRKKKPQCTRIQQ